MISAEKRKNSLGGSSISSPMNKRQKDLLKLDNKKQSNILQKCRKIANQEEESVYLKNTLTASLNSNSNV